MSDPNAALWASITPPANPTLTTQIRRRAAAFSLDLLAHRLYLRFPETFSSRATARFGIVAATALAAGLGVLGYFAMGPSSLATSLPAHVQASIVTSRGAAHADDAVSTSLVRLGETAIEPVTPTLAATAAPAVSAQLIERLTPRGPLADADTTTPKATRATAKKKTKSTARRATKSRRARITND
jgi:hypothetical protein